jgi:phage tail-like protein
MMQAVAQRRGDKMPDPRQAWIAGRRISSDPEWKYVNLRRYFAYLEHSIDRGTQWAVFEPNDEVLWANVRRAVEDFLLSEWQSGALLGDRPEQAYFVKCDRSTMSQDDIDHGRLVCVVGVAPLCPAEFVILRIGQWTADRKRRKGSGIVDARDHPYRHFDFLVDFADGATAGFHEVSGIAAEDTVSKRRRGKAKQQGVAKITGLNKSTDITLRRGVIGSLNLYSWLEQIGRKDHRPLRQVTIRRQNKDRTAVVQTWKLTRGRIIKHTSGPFNAKGSDVAMDELVLGYGRLELKRTDESNGGGDADPP